MSAMERPRCCEFAVANLPSRAADRALAVSRMMLGFTDVPMRSGSVSPRAGEEQGIRSVSLRNSLFVEEGASRSRSVNR